MSNLSAEVILKWGDGKYLFALKGKQIDHLQKLCGAGIEEIAKRLLTGKAYMGDIKYTIHLGLEGGGMPPVTVADMMDRFFDGQPLANPIDPSSPYATAQAIIGAAWFGFEDLTEPKKSTGKGTPSQKSPRARKRPVISTEPATKPHS